MKCLTIITTAVLFAVGSAATGEIVQVEYEDGPQDPLVVPKVVLELGLNFPPDELIQAAATSTEYTPCPENPDDPLIPNALVRMTNLTKVAYDRVWYVGDGVGHDGVLETTLQNMDGWVNGGLAFKIDNLKINKPLVAEIGGIPGDNIWQPNETWDFVIQDYQNVFGLPAAAFLSPARVGNFSTGDTISSGSIIAIPEPATMALLGLGGLAALVRRRRPR